MKKWIGGCPRLFVVRVLLTRAARAGRKLLLLLRKICKVTGEAHTDIPDCLDDRATHWTAIKQSCAFITKPPEMCQFIQLTNWQIWCLRSPVLAWQQLDVGSVVKADCAGVLLHAQSLHRLKLHRPRENLALLVTQFTHIIERLELPLGRISVRSPAEIKLTLLEWHETRSGKEARTERK